MRIIFVYESNHPIKVEDGLSAALDSLDDSFDIIRINLAECSIPIDDDDFVLAWGAFGSGPDQFARRHINPKGLCIGGINPPIDMFEYDVLFYETKWYREMIKFHPNIIHAFGVSRDVYKNLNLGRDIDYLGVGAFAKWKRWEKMLDKKGRRKVIGEYQKGNKEETDEIVSLLEKGGVECQDMIPAGELCREYNRAKTVYLPATIYGGGERAVLEARACGCKVEIEKDNPKLEELIYSPIYDVPYYTKALKKGINDISRGL